MRQPLTFDAVKSILSTDPGVVPPAWDELCACRETLYGLLEEEPGNTGYLQELTRALIMMGRPSEALEILGRPRPVDKQYALRAACGMVYFNRQQWPEAAEEYRAALSGEPDNMAWLYRMAIIENKLGRLESSREFVARILRLEASGPRRFKNRILLRNLSALNGDTRALLRLGLKKTEAAHLSLRLQFLPSHSKETGYVWNISSQLCDFYKKLCDRTGPWRPSRRDLAEIFPASGVTLYKNAFYCRDVDIEHVKVVDGCRLTTDQPETFHRRVNLFGPSTVFGAYCADRHTIASFLQNQYNKDRQATAVVNYGVGGQLIDNTLLQIMNTEFTDDDLLISLLIFSELARLGVEAVLRYASAINDVCRKRGLEYCLALLPRLQGLSRLSYYDQKLRAIGGLFCQPVPEETIGVLANRLTAEGVRTFDLQPLIDGESAGNMFLDEMHFSPNGAKAVAEALFSVLTAAGSGKTFSEKPAKDLALARMARAVRNNYADHEGMEAWLGMAAAAPPSVPGPFGAIVMNCNPFTNGHLHLISEALKQTGGLYIFVVEEDRSRFAFQDRLQMVRAGVERFGGKTSVLPSGRFIISSFSFSGYFAKEEPLAAADMDASTDVAIFAAVIAPALNINRRFVGEEPFCRVTAAYNQSMLFMLPPLGVDVTVIERSRQDGRPISASAVRRAMEKGRWDRVSSMVPPSTLAYLQNLKNR